jgi:hypothetical protein
MEKWYKKVRDMKDESEDSYLTQMITHEIYRDLWQMRIKDKGKFKNRMGPEFESWTESLSHSYPKTALIAILNDDEFWALTLEVALKL